MEKNNNIKSSSSNQFVKGWSWGNIRLKNSAIEFESNNQQWFNIPYNNISNVLLPTKNEIGLEFNLEEEGDIKYYISYNVVKMISYVR